MNAKAIGGLAGAWLLMGCGGLLAMLHYEKEPGEPTRPPATWPAESGLAGGGDATLLMFVHPHCPCTRASLGELAVLMARAPGAVSAQVVFIRPAGVPDAWVKTDLWETARAIPGVEVRIDRDGVEARRFHAATSGATILYERGRLLFAGGITSGRGHAGDNAGRSALLAMLAGQEKGAAETAVYGCPLSEKTCRRDEP